jgi:hypothetical protein
MWLQTVAGYDLPFEGEPWMNFADVSHFFLLNKDKTRRSKQIGQ